MRVFFHPDTAVSYAVVTLQSEKSSIPKGKIQRVTEKVRKAVEALDFPDLMLVDVLVYGPEAVPGVEWYVGRDRPAVQRRAVGQESGLPPPREVIYYWFSEQTHKSGQTLRMLDVDSPNAKRAADWYARVVWSRPHGYDDEKRPDPVLDWEARVWWCEENVVKPPGAGPTPRLMED